MPRMTSRTMLFCHMELKWNDSDADPCRDEVQNNPESISKHMIEKHGWSEIPDLALRDILAKRPHPKNTGIMTKEQYIEFTDLNPEEWFFDNQLIWREFRNFHFKKTLSNLRKGDEK